MGNNIINEISKENLLTIVKNIRDKGGRLVAINGYVNKEKTNIVVYTLEYDDVREQYRIIG